MSTQEAALEMEAKFWDNCKDSTDSPLRLEAGARDLLDAFFADNIAPLLESGAITWGGKDRKFALSCAADLGKALASAAASAGRQVSPDLIRQVTPNLIDTWERACPLPPVPELGTIPVIASTVKVGSSVGALGQTAMACRLRGQLGT